MVGADLWIQGAIYRKEKVRNLRHAEVPHRTGTRGQDRTPQVLDFMSRDTKKAQREFITRRILVIGGYGNFGRFISSKLAQEGNLQLTIAGRSLDKARQFVSELGNENEIEAIKLDIDKDFEQSLSSIKPDIVIHTSGPFQSQDYHVAKACIAQGAHYIDLADGRKFACNVTELDEEARANDVLVISGASSVPCLTAAIVDHYREKFRSLEKLDYGITTAQKTPRGLATTAAILGYTGKPFKTLVDGKMKDVYGLQGLKARRYKELGWRLLGYCDVPDFSLFPGRYPDLTTIRFYAGLELPTMHVALWLISWLVRNGLIRNLEKAAPVLLKIAGWFDWLGTDKSGFHMKMSGVGGDGKDKTMTFELIARSGDGPYIPCVPAILLARKLAKGELPNTGACPCVGFITMEEYLNELKDLDISWEVY